MKRFIWCVSVLLVISICLSLPANAVTEVEPRGSDYFMASSTYIDVYGTRLEIWFDITAVGMMDKLGVNSIEVQRSTDRVNWTSMHTYDSSLYSGFIDTNTSAHAGYISYYGTSGYYYRACVEYYAKKGTGSALMTEYSSSVLCG